MEEITLNGKTYVLKEDITFNAFQRFPLELEFKLIQKLSKMFNYAIKPINPGKLLTFKSVYALDPANIMMVEAKTQQAKFILSYFIEDEVKDLEVREFKQSPDNDGRIGSYSLEYIKKIIEIANIQGEAIKIIQFSKEPMPICFETLDFKFILAPRINDLEDEEKNKIYGVKE